MANNCLIKTAESQVGVVEKTGNNDGVQVEAYLKTVGLGKGYSYCAAFVKWVFLQCGFKTNINAWSPTKTMLYLRMVDFKKNLNH